MRQDDPKIAKAGNRTQVPSAALPVVDTALLFGQSSEVRVVHRGAEYRLRITRQGKLILTK